MRKRRKSSTNEPPRREARHMLHEAASKWMNCYFLSPDVCKHLYRLLPSTQFNFETSSADEPIFFRRLVMHMCLHLLAVLTSPIDSLFAYCFKQRNSWDVMSGWLIAMNILAELLAQGLRRELCLHRLVLCFFRPEIHRLQLCFPPTMYSPMTWMKKPQQDLENNSTFAFFSFRWRRPFTGWDRDLGWSQLKRGNSNKKKRFPSFRLFFSLGHGFIHEM